MSSTVSPIGETADERTRLRRSAGLSNSSPAVFSFLQQCDAGFGVRSGLSPKGLPSGAALQGILGICRCKGFSVRKANDPLVLLKKEQKIRSLDERLPEAPGCEEPLFASAQRQTLRGLAGRGKRPFVCPAEHVHTRAIVRGIGIGMGLPSIERTLRCEDRITEIEREIHVLPVAQIVLGQSETHRPEG